jgi:hypothetical protein
MNRAKELAKNLQICADLNRSCVGCAYKSIADPHCYQQLKLKSAEELERLDAELAHMRSEISGLNNEVKRLRGKNR